MSRPKSNQESTFESCPNEEEIAYFLVPRAFIRNSKISMECRGFLTYLMSHSEKFKISMPWVLKTQKLTKHLLYKMIDEAIEHGYLKREVYSEKGWKRYRYILSRNGAFKNYLHCPKFQDTENQDTEISDSKDSQSPTETKEEQKREKKEATLPLSRQFCYKRLKMQRSRYENLVFQHGQEKVNRFMDELDEYADIKPKAFKEYGDHAIVLARWIRREEEYMPSGKTEYRGHQDAIQSIKRIEELCLPAFANDIQIGADYVHFVRIPGAFFKADDGRFPLAVKMLLTKIKVPQEIIKKIFKGT